MATIKVTTFGGEIPRLPARALPPGAAQLNQNLLATATEFRPLQSDAPVSAAINQATTLYRFSRKSDGTLQTDPANGWITSTDSRSYVKGQLNDDATERTYVSFNNGTQPPRLIDITGRNRLLGVPSPLKPTLVHTPASEFTLEKANVWVTATLSPAVKDAVTASTNTGQVPSRITAGVPNAGPTSVYGLTQGADPWKLLRIISSSSAQTGGFTTSAVGEQYGTTQWSVGIVALPYWSPINRTTLLAQLRTIENPKDGSQLFAEDRIGEVADDIIAYYSPAQSKISAQRKALDTAVKDFNTSIDFVLTAGAARPVEPSKPSVTEYSSYGDGPLERDYQWVQYDNAMKDYRVALDTWTKDQGALAAQKTAKMARIQEVQAQAETLTRDIETVYFSLQTKFEQWFASYVQSIGIAKTDTNQDGLIELDPDRIVDSRFYFATYVTDLGEESAPGPLTDLIDVDQNDTIVVTIPSPPAGRDITKWRLYRSNVGTTSADFQFVAEGSTGTPTDRTFNDDVEGSELGEVCPTKTWLEPPYRADTQSSATVKPLKGTDPYIKGFVGMPNGIIAGFIDNYVAFCEPYVPYAWPVEYQVSTEYEVVGLGVFGQTLFVGTTGNPYLISGSDSASMSALKLDSAQSCASAQSIAAIGGGVVYASPDGLCFASSAGVELLTAALFSREDWQALTPSSVVGASYESVYYFSYAGSGGGCFALDFTAKKLTRVSMVPTAFFYDTPSDALYFTQDAWVRKAFSTSRRVGKWQSGVMTLPAQAPLSWVKVYGEQSASAPVVIRWYGDGGLRHTATFTDLEPQRLPPGRWLSHVVDVESTARVVAVVLAGSTQELQNV